MKFRSHNLYLVTTRRPVKQEQPCYGYLYQGYRFPRSSSGTGAAKATIARQVIFNTESALDVFVNLQTEFTTESALNAYSAKESLFVTQSALNAYVTGRVAFTTQSTLNAFVPQQANFTTQSAIAVYVEHTAPFSTQSALPTYSVNIGLFNSQQALNAYTAQQVGFTTQSALAAYTASFCAFTTQSALDAAEKFFAWAINLTTGAVSKYDNYAFNSLSGGLGSDSTGIHTLTGTTDNGVAINGFVESGKLMLSQGSMLTRAIDAYIGVDGGALNLTITDERTGANTYKIPATTQLRTSKANLGRGCKGRYWAVKIANVAGSAAKVDDVEINIEKLSRRV